ELVLGVMAQTSAGLAVSITGIAGPGGGTAAKPVGTVHIGLGWRAEGGVQAHTRRFVFPGDREDVRRRACISALSGLYFHLAGRRGGEPRLLWEVAPGVETAPG